MKELFCKVIDNIEGFFLKLLKRMHFNKMVDVYEKHKEGMRYLVFGGLATVVNILVFWICKTSCKLSTTPSNFLAWIVAAMFAYITNKWFVFDAKTNTWKECFLEMASFLGARVFTLILETVLLNITIDYMQFNSILMKVLSNILVILLNFLFSKLWIFKNNQQANT